MNMHMHQQMAMPGDYRMMSPEPYNSAEERFQELVRLRAFKGRTLTRQDEEALLQEAVLHFGLNLQRARALLVAESTALSMEMESDLDDMAVGMLDALADSRKKISQRSFGQIASYYAKRSRRTEAEAERKVKQLMEDNDLRPKPAGLFRSTRWYRRIR